MANTPTERMSATDLSTNSASQPSTIPLWNYEQCPLIRGNVTRIVQLYAADTKQAELIVDIHSMSLDIGTHVDYVSVINILPSLQYY